MVARLALRPWLRHHPMPRYIVTGGLSLLVDLLVLDLLHGVAGLELVLSTVLAYMAAYCVNFSLSRWWTFRSTRTAAARSQVVRYTALVLANLGVTILIVTGLVATGVNYLIAKLVAAVVIAGVNFLIARRWVFV
jgi:putative flippase GtrA